KSFADGLANGSMTALVLPDVIPLEGGLPIVVGDRVIGAVGVSGVRSSEDAQIAQAGIEALLAKLQE
ncbi:MAG: heme-binding protein, partial [Gemmatimonadetes bacterium]|nr:heme-binding protein [Gemmatimonadota bacterium]